MDKVSFSKYGVFVSIVAVCIFIYIMMKKSEKFSIYDMGLAPHVMGEQKADWEKEVNSYNNFITASHVDSPTVVAEKERELLEKTNTLSPEILLPPEDSNLSLLGKNFLANAFDAGVSTRGANTKNANLQLRSDPVVPKIANLTPFNNSSYEQDPYRKKFEIVQ